MKRPKELVVTSERWKRMAPSDRFMLIQRMGSGLAFSDIPQHVTTQELGAIFDRMGPRETPEEKAERKARKAAKATAELEAQDLLERQELRRELEEALRGEG